MKCNNGWLGGRGAGLMFAVWIALVPAGKAALAGAWETFFDEYNTESWGLYDDADGEVYLPFWSEQGEFAYSTYTGDAPMSFFADAQVGNGAFVGNYPAERVAGVACDIYVGDLSVLAAVDCSVYANGPGGKRYYYSEEFYGEDFSAAGWWSLWFDFNVPWYYYDSVSSRWVEVDARTLEAVEELSFNFYPVEGSAGGTVAGIDDVTLEPTLEAPALAVASDGGLAGEFRLTFTPGPGLECRVERRAAEPSGLWEAVAGETGLKGPAAHVFRAPLADRQAIFRVATEASYTAVVSE